jgi:hypothetical protein
MEGVAEPRDLFGGALQAVIPRRFRDISDLRTVPDNQEVLVDVDTDQTLVVEVLEYEAGIADADAAVYFFRDLAEANDSSDSADVLSVAAVDVARDAPVLLSVLPDDGSVPPVYLGRLEGTQRVSRFREGAAAANDVVVLLACVRLPAQGSDVLLTLTAPTRIAPSSSSFASTADAPQHTDASVATARLVFDTALSTLRVVDWGLFGS